MSLNVTGSGPSIVQPLACFKNMLLKLNVHSVSKFYEQSSENQFRTYWWQLFMNIWYSWFSIGILINNGSTSYNTSSSSSCKSVIEDNKLGLFSVSLIEYSFLHKGLKYHYH